MTELVSNDAWIPGIGYTLVKPLSLSVSGSQLVHGCSGSDADELNKAVNQHQMEMQSAIGLVLLSAPAVNMQSGSWLTQSASAGLPAFMEAFKHLATCCQWPSAHCMLRRLSLFSRLHAEYPGLCPEPALARLDWRTNGRCDQQDSMHVIVIGRVSCLSRSCGLETFNSVLFLCMITVLTMFMSKRAKLHMAPKPSSSWFSCFMIYFAGSLLSIAISLQSQAIHLFTNP